MLDETLRVKLDAGLPISPAETTRLTRSIMVELDNLQAKLNNMQKDFDEFKVSIPGSRVDSTAQTVAPAVKLRSKPDQ